MFIPKESLIGRDVAKIDAAERATGRTVYIHDLDDLLEELEPVPLR